MDEDGVSDRAPGSARKGGRQLRPASPEPLAGGGPPPAESMLARVEEVLEARLPPAYRQFLARGNGGLPLVSRYLDGGTGELRRVAAFLPLAAGVPGSVFSVMESHGERLPPGALPIARDPSGDLLLLGIGEPWGGEVLLWESEREPEEDAAGNVTWTNVHAVAASFAELLERFVAD